MNKTTQTNQKAKQAINKLTPPMSDSIFLADDYRLIRLNRYSAEALNETVKAVNS